MKLEYKEVATKSLALETLIGSLMSWNGLQSVIRCIDTGTILHGESFENPGIMECHTLYRSFEKCRAEGLPPPIRIPSEAEARKQAAEEDKKQAEAKKKAQEESEKDENEHDQISQAKGEDKWQTELCDLLIFTGGAGVSAAPYKDARAERQETITAQLHAIINRVQFCDTPDELVAKSRAPLQNTSRAFVVVQTPTTTSGDFSQLLDIAKQVSDSYLSGTDSGVTRIQFRIVVLVGERYELLAKMQERGKLLWPEWTFIVVQLRKEVLQSHTVRPSYAVVLALPGDILEEPTTITLPKCLIAEQGVNMRCTEANCPYRKTVLDAAAAKKVSQDDEIQIGDRMLMLDSKLEQA
jgi:hypothetical protein